MFGCAVALRSPVAELRYLQRLEETAGSLGEGFWPGEVLMDKEMQFYKALGGGEARHVSNSSRARK